MTSTSATESVGEAMGDGGEGKGRLSLRARLLYLKQKSSMTQQKFWVLSAYRGEELMGNVRDPKDPNLYIGGRTWKTRRGPEASALTMARMFPGRFSVGEAIPCHQDCTPED